MTFKEFEEKAKNEYITINKDQFATATVMEQYIKKDKIDMAMITPFNRSKNCGGIIR